MEENKTHEGHSHTDGHVHEAGQSHEGHQHSAPKNSNMNLGPEMSLPKFDSKNLDFQAGFNRLLDILKLNSSAIEQVAKDEKLNMIALIFLVAGVVLGPIASAIFGYSAFGFTVRPSIVSVLIQIVVQLVMVGLVFFVTSLVATKVFNGKGTFAEFFRVMGIAYVINVLGFLYPLVPALAPIVGLVVGVWALAIEFVTLKTVFKLDATNAVLTIIVTVIVMMVLGAVIASVGVGSAISAGNIGRGAVGNIQFNP